MLCIFIYIYLQRLIFANVILTYKLYNVEGN